VLELIGDALWGWVVERAARSATASPSASTGSQAAKVYRYIFDQASPYTDMPHHAVDLLYLFANVPLPELPELTQEENEEFNWDRVRVRDAMQGRWLAFAHGEAPWTPLLPPSSLSTSESSSAASSDKIYVIGPEGETGERCMPIFEGRRRVDVWAEAFEPLGLRVVHKVGTELGNGPPAGRMARF